LKDIVEVHRLPPEKEQDFIGFSIGSFLNLRTYFKEIHIPSQWKLWAGKGARKSHT